MSDQNKNQKLFFLFGLVSGVAIMSLIVAIVLLSKGGSLGKNQAGDIDKVAVTPTPIQNLKKQMRLRFQPVLPSLQVK